MGLKKEIILENGITVNYHRIVSINKITNISTILEVASYTSKEKRQEEERYQEIQNRKKNGENLTDEEQSILENGINVFIETDYINTEYSEENNIDFYYNYLKTTEKFINAEDV